MACSGSRTNMNDWHCHFMDLSGFIGGPSTPHYASTHRHRRQTLHSHKGVQITRFKAQTFTMGLLQRSKPIFVKMSRLSGALDPASSELAICSTIHCCYPPTPYLANKKETSHMRNTGPQQRFCITRWIQPENPLGKRNARCRTAGEGKGQ